MTAIRVGHLYPDYLNIYADRGNIAVLDRRAAWRGHDLDVSALGMGDAVAPGEHDLYYIGGGQDREQLLVAEDLVRKAAELHEAVGRGAAVLAVCGGYQLLGRGYRAGFENHAGRTRLDPGAEPLGWVLAGFGNDGESGFEGCRAGRVIGTYLHGPLLPRNAGLADWLLGQALAHRLGTDEPPELEPLPDRLEHRAHEVSATRARARGGR